MITRKMPISQLGARQLLAKPTPPPSIFKGGTTMSSTDKLSDIARRLKGLLRDIEDVFREEPLSVTAYFCQGKVLEVHLTKKAFFSAFPDYETTNRNDADIPLRFSFEVGDITFFAIGRKSDIPKRSAENG